MPLEILTPQNKCRLIGEEIELIVFETPECLKIQSLVSAYKTARGKSYRYLMTDESGKVLSALQVMAKSKRKATMVNVHTHKDYRRRGYAMKLVRFAKMDFANLTFSRDLTDDGKAFIEGIKYRS